MMKIYVETKNRVYMFENVVKLEVFKRINSINLSVISSESSIFMRENFIARRNEVEEIEINDIEKWYEVE